MSGFLLEYGGFLLRWLHVVAAIAWIGESFYFVALDRGLRTPAQPAPGLAGESWSVHGGGFYRKQKYLPAPPQLPAELHWSKWKSYTTWLSGFALLLVLYLLSPRIALIDPAVAALSPAQAVWLAVGFPLAAWLAYDVLCRLAGARDLLLGALVALLVLLLCYVATQLFAGRAAFLLAGAALGTIMSANVFFVIIPGQKRLVAALQAGRAPDPRDGQRGKQRSVHNTYFTLPVVFAMLSIHFAGAYAHPLNWIVLAGFMAAGALLRQFFVLWHSGGRAWWLLVAGGALLLALGIWLAPARPAHAPSADVPAAHVAAPDAQAVNVEAPPVTVTNPEIPAAAVAAAPVQPEEFVPGGAPATEALLPLLARHCGGCHAARPTLMAFAASGLMFDTAAQAEQHAARIHRQTVVLKSMPPGNFTGMSEAEREAIDRWYAGLGAGTP